VFFELFYSSPNKSPKIVETSTPAAALATFKTKLVLRQNQTMKNLATLLLSFALLCSGTSFAQDAPQMDLPRVKLGAGMHLIDTQVAATPEQRSIGLMFRQQMPQAEGMLFVFEQAGQQCFWMKNTRCP
jgi:hypothetical protein